VPDLVEFRKSKRNVTREMAEALEFAAARERVLYVVDNVPEPGPDEKPQPLETWCPAIGKVSNRSARLGVVRPVACLGQ
jgi:hypothetical protein